MLDSQGLAGEGVGDRDVGGAVVGHQLLDLDPVGAVEGERPSQKADRGGCLLVRQDLHVGKASGVIDADVDPLPARAQSPAFAPLDLRVAPAGNAVPRSLGADPAELLDVDVDQLSGAGALVAASPPPPLPAGGACPAPWALIRPSFLTSMWISSPGRERS